MACDPETVQTGASSMRKEYTTFTEFYPFYLSEHSHPMCRRLHVIGSAFVLAMIGYAVLTQRWTALLALPIIGYGFAWIGHFFFEKNRPATLTYPLYSLMGDWVMFKDVLTGRLRF
jgi:hypothetical protein